MKIKNWKTTFFGFASVVSGIALIFKGHLVEGISAITTGIGLKFAKDYNNRD